VVGDTRGRWDAARLQQLLRNLVTNAIRYGAPNTTVQVMLIGDGPNVRLEVMNRGPVIERSTMAELFHPLTRGPARTGHRDSQSGLGLGLYIVREVARAHGGEVDVRSEEEETVFAVRLPRDTQGPAS
jgi:signal transduction histidine kinase